MHKTREPRRASMAATTDGFPRRRHRTVPLAHFSEEGQWELRHTPRSRPLTGKKDKDRDRVRDSSHRNKKKRGSHRQESEQSIEDSVENEQDFEIDDAGVSRMLSPHSASSASDQHHRRILPPAKPVRPTLPPCKMTDEMIGVTVPRKARSASAKRSHDSWASASAGGAEQNSLQRSNVTGRQSVEAASPSSSNDSVRKKMKAIGPQASPPKMSKSSSSNQEDIEIEIAELLYCLLASKKLECSQKPETNEPRDANPSSYLSKDVEKKIVEDYNSSTPVPNESTAETVKFERMRPVKLETRAPAESTKMSGFNDENATVRDSGALEEGIADGSLNSGAECDVTVDGISVSLKGELPSCSKLHIEEQDSSSTRASFVVPEANSQRVKKFQIDLMAPPPMVVSPERDNFTSETKALTLDVELRRESNVKVKGEAERQEKTEKEQEEMKMDAFKEKRDLLIFELEKQNKDNNSTTGNKLEEHNGNQEQHLKLTNPKVEKPVQSMSVPFPTAVPGWSSSQPPLGNMPPLLTVAKTNKTTKSSPTLQDASFVPSQPQPKRCASHYYIARNIFLHQQFTRANHIWPAAVGSASLCGTKPTYVNGIPSAESVVAKQSPKELLGMNQSSAQEKERATSSFLGLAANEISDAASSLNSTHTKQTASRQGPHPASADELMHGPASLFPLGQHQPSATSQAGVLNSTSTASSSDKPNSSAAGSNCSSSASPAISTVTNSRYLNLAANDTPYVAIVQKNGYPFPFSTPLGATTAMRGTSPAQTTHTLNGPFYASQMFHPQLHPHSQVRVQPGYINTSTSKIPSHRQSRGTQVNGNNILSSAAMQVQCSQKQHASQSHPRKSKFEVGGDNAPTYSQKNVYGQNFTIPVQPVNFSFKPSATSDSAVGSGRNFNDQQQKQQDMGGLEHMPSQAFGVSFAAFNGTSTSSNLNFSSMPQNQVIFQSLPDIAWQGYQTAGTLHTAQLKTYSLSKGKSGGNSSHQNDEKKANSGKSSKNGPTTLNFDDSSKNLNFVLSPMNGSWPNHSIASAATTTSVPLPSNVSSSQQLLQLQKQYGIQQQQPSTANRYKISPTNGTSATKLENNRSPSQCNSSDQASQSKSLGRTTDSQLHHASIITSNNPSLKFFYQEQGKVFQGHTQISFGENYSTSLPPQGQQLLNNKKFGCTKVAGSPPNGGNLKQNSQGNKRDSSIYTLQKQQTENSSPGSGQKSSPVGGRNVPSLLSSGPSHLSKLKY